MTHRTIRYFLLWLIVTVYQSAQAVTPAPVIVQTYGQHIGGNIVYNHQVTNNSSRNIVGIAFAEDTDQIDIGIEFTTDMGELSTVMPLGYVELAGDVPPASVSSPMGWSAEIIQIRDAGLFLQWYSSSYPFPDIQPGQTAHFSVTTPMQDTAYLTGHFSARFGGFNGNWKYNGVMEKLDVTPPTLSVSLSPSSIPLAQRGQVIPITATITVSDNYDPAPDIQLVSITANETLAASDVQGAATGADDRNFSLSAAHTSSSAARIYTVTYSATDASGNTSTASATVSAY